MNQKELDEQVLEFIRTTWHPDGVDILSHFKDHAVLDAIRRLREAGMIERVYLGIVAWYEVRQADSKGKEVLRDER